MYINVRRFKKVGEYILLWFNISYHLLLENARLEIKNENRAFYD